MQRRVPIDIESVDFGDHSWLEFPGYIHSNEMKVTERYTRTGDVRASCRMSAPFEQLIPCDRQLMHDCIESVHPAHVQAVRLTRGAALVASLLMLRDRHPDAIATRA